MTHWLFPDIRFAWPLWLLGLLLLPVLALWRGKRGRAPAVKFPMAILLKDIGLARPQKITSTDESKTEGIAIALTVDVSLSMLIEDFRIGGVSVNRLTAAKRVMRDFIKGRDNDRVGIVAFAGAPYTPCPLTLDHEWLESNIDRVQTGVMEDGTAIGSGLAAAARRHRTRGGTAETIGQRLLIEQCARVCYVASTLELPTCGSE